MLNLSLPAPRSGERYIEKMRLMEISSKMTRAGWLVDRGRIEAHRREALARVHHYSEVFLKESGLSADDMGASGEGKTGKVREYFLETQAAPVVAVAKRTQRPQVNSAALVEWATKDRSAPWAKSAAALYAVRKNRKLIEFCGTYLQFSMSDGRIHFEFNPIGTVTGRWTSSTRMRVVVEGGNGKIPKRKKMSCNAQQIPKKIIEFDFGNGPEVLTSSLRDCYLPDPGCVLLRADYDQLELRLIAYLAGVAKLIDALETGTDIHCLTAAHIFKELGLSTVRDKGNKVAENAREAAKSCAYGISYLMSLPGKKVRHPTLLKTLRERFPSISERQLELIVHRFFDLYPEIQSSQQDTKRMIDEHGYVDLAVNGRRLHYPATMRGYNQALNFPKQGTGGALADRAMVEIDGGLNWERGQQIRGQVHDEIICQARYEDAAYVAELMSTAMSRPAQIGATYIGVPAAADPGLDWGSCMEYETFRDKHPGLLRSA